MLQLSQINIYPVKSLDGYSPTKAIVEKKGLQYDRRWMLVDEDGVFMTQRNYRKMTLLKAIVDNNNLEIFVKNNVEQKVIIPTELENDELEVQVWQDKVMANKTSQDADAFLSDFFEKKCHLVKMPNSSIRRVDEDYNRGNDSVSFADGFPFLIIGEASLNDLNSKLKAPLNPENQPLVGLRRFRANFIFSGGQPYEEETWQNFSIGDIKFYGAKPCGRCIMITLDPDTGIREPEPLEVLASYRSVGKKIKFGQNVLWKHETWNWAFHPEINVGDIIQIIK